VAEVRAMGIQYLTGKADCLMEQLSKRLMNWASILEPKTREQAERASAMPFIYPHLALMPEHRVEQCFEDWLGAAIEGRREEVNCHHNYTAQETHFDKEVWLSR
jgi:RNA-splicing ligase RtcB